jgi:flavin-dependent dehydrogenase
MANSQAMNAPLAAAAPREAVEIAGAGLAGLAAAITLARAGRRVVVHEAHPCVGYRFGRDLQGIENWTTRGDALAWLRGLGIDTKFDALACRDGTLFDAKGRAHRARSRDPIFYLVERGPRTGSLDAAMLAQALSLGVDVRFGSRVERGAARDVMASGPRNAHAIAVGYHFDTTMRDGFWTICDDALAPGGYAYLLVMNGRGTVKTCMFARFDQAWRNAERTVGAFERLAGLTMANVHPHGGVATLRAAGAEGGGERPLVGEQAGFQDALWGFGMRYAIASGVLAARSLLEATSYETLWRKELMPWYEASLVNRAIYDRAGNRGYAWLLRAQAWSRDSRRFLRWLYYPGPVHRALVPWARAQTRTAPASVISG